MQTGAKSFGVIRFVGLVDSRTHCAYSTPVNRSSEVRDMTDSLSGSFQVEMALATGVEPALSSLTGTHVDRYTTPASNSHEPPLATASETLTATDPRFSSAPLLAERCPPCISKDERAKRYLNARARYEAQRCPVCAHRHDPDGVCRVSCDDDCTYRCGCVARS